MSDDIYRPHLMDVFEIIDETSDVRTLRMRFRDPEVAKSFTYRPGQFCELSVFGSGEATFCVASTPTRPDVIECSIKRVGLVTEHVHNLEVGSVVGLRGPYGNYFPDKDLHGKNLIFIGGGIGLAPLRSLINYVIDNRADYGKVDIIYGARSPGDLVYKKELDIWAATKDIDLHLTVDQGDENWKGNVGFIPVFLTQLNPSKENAKAITCGPPIMIKFVVKALADMGFADQDIITTLEMKMKCGIGKCGRCNIGHQYVCQDGPVFTYDQIKEMPNEF